MIAGSVASQLWLRRQRERVFPAVLTSRPFNYFWKEHLAAIPGEISEVVLETAYTLVNLESPAEFLGVLPELTLLHLSALPQEFLDRILTVPEVGSFQLSLSVAAPKEFVGVVPQLVNLDLGISYTQWAFEGVVVTPSLTEILVT